MIVHAALSTMQPALPNGQGKFFRRPNTRRRCSGIQSAGRPISMTWSALLDGNRFLGIEWHFWKVLGWIGNVVFFSRFFVQWVATEKRKQVVVPISFWWLSLIGSILLLAYGLWQRDSVFIFAYAFTWVPYIRSLVIHYRNKAAQRNCPECHSSATHDALFCPQCGLKLTAAGERHIAVPNPTRPAFA